jgi:hypothetical protein
VRWSWALKNQRDLSHGTVFEAPADESQHDEEEKEKEENVEMVDVEMMDRHQRRLSLGIPKTILTSLLAWNWKELAAGLYR